MDTGQTNVFCICSWSISRYISFIVAYCATSVVSSARLLQRVICTRATQSHSNSCAISLSVNQSIRTQKEHFTRTWISRFVQLHCLQFNFNTVKISTQFWTITIILNSQKMLFWQHICPVLANYNLSFLLSLNIHIRMNFMLFAAYSVSILVSCRTVKSQWFLFLTCFSPP